METSKERISRRWWSIPVNVAAKSRRGLSFIFTDFHAFPWNGRFCGVVRHKTVWGRLRSKWKVRKLDCEREQR